MKTPICTVLPGCYIASMGWVESKMWRVELLLRNFCGGSGMFRYVGVRVP